ncbi:MAG TPA: hypothetical protein VKY19_01535 [Ktedonosporobacter sp.]|jgi:hypothetical protein|nr:hypothetical protein [Ktedonosporobacter sp.]
MKLLTRARRSIASALLLTLLLMLGITGVASASSPTPTDVAHCLTAAPATQTVGVNQLAKVQITVICVPQVLRSFVDVAWGDQTVSEYPLCVDVCPVPPIVVNATHSYAKVGFFHPNICVVPSPLGAVPDCVQVEVIVIQLAS